MWVAAVSNSVYAAGKRRYLFRFIPKACLSEAVNTTTTTTRPLLCREVNHHPRGGASLSIERKCKFLTFFLDVPPPLESPSLC